MEPPVNNFTLMSVKHYNKVDTRFAGMGDETKCEKLKSELHGQLNKYPGFSKFCSSLIGNLEFFNYLPYLEFFKHHSCKYFNLWICDRMSKELVNLNVDKYNNIKNKIKEIWNDYELIKECKPDFISYMDDMNYNKIKNLYEYALNYDTLVKYYDQRGSLCSMEYKKYIEESLKTYEEAKHKCSSDTESLLCIALKDVRAVYNKEELSNITCNGTISLEKIRREVKQSLVPEVAHLDTQESRVASIDVERLSTGQYDTYITTPEGESSVSSSYKATLIVFPLFGILFILFSSYKFTPFGSWLKKYILNITNNQNNIEQKVKHNLLDNELEAHNINLIEGSHYISYNPS
ncbi:PIR Superfamily Protein [Plasmodium ovale wallikeri]|uniref:PIR Superfamily Protein n=2 Tax=Plasmodium ovale TaxID=36330 RepID=A0A1A9AG70_PLAOA|nr:PIR Superfamily Protein [Plasmodium ovale wallikeri]SBT55954.1 PIR Superfamily Protein [Plasmodium ovale wallikeri]SBT73811.1 Plasmodium vivax Vir protein, putative [Plasmodium ovale]